MSFQDLSFLQESAMPGCLEGTKMVGFGHAIQ